MGKLRRAQAEKFMEQLDLAIYEVRTKFRVDEEDLHCDIRVSIDESVGLPEKKATT